MSVWASWSCGKDGVFAVHEARRDGVGVAGLLAALPPGVDPCGENGECHTVVTDGPGFATPVDVVVGPPVERDGFVFSPPSAAGT